MEYKRPVEDIKLVADFLSVVLDDDNPANLREQMGKSVAWLARVAYLKRKAEQEYRTQKNRYLLPKDKEFTELDRETRVNADVAEIYYDFGLLQDYEKALYTRISSCQTLINSHMVEMKLSPQASA